jgi:hypothetical protein
MVTVFDTAVDSPVRLMVEAVVGPPAVGPAFTTHEFPAAVGRNAYITAVMGEPALPPPKMGFAVQAPLYTHQNMALLSEPLEEATAVFHIWPPALFIFKVTVARQWAKTTTRSCACKAAGGVMVTVAVVELVLSAGLPASPTNVGCAKTRSTALSRNNIRITIARAGL